MYNSRSHSRGQITMLDRSPSPPSVVVLDSPEILNLFTDGFSSGGFKEPLINLRDDDIFESDSPNYTPTKARPPSNPSSQTKVPRTRTTSATNNGAEQLTEDNMGVVFDYQEDVVTRELTPEFIRFADLVFDWVDNNCAPFRTGWMEGTKVDALFAMCGVDAGALETLRKKRYRGMCFLFQNLECDHVLLSTKGPTPPALHRRSTIRTARAELRRSSVIRFSAPVSLQDASDSCRKSITGLGLRQRISNPQPQQPQCPAPPSPGYPLHDRGQRTLPRRRPRIGINNKNNSDSNENHSYNAHRLTTSFSKVSLHNPSLSDEPLSILPASSFPSTMNSSSSPYIPAIPRSGFYKVLLALSAISLDALPVCVLAMSGGHSSCDPALHPSPRELENWLPADVRDSLQACFHGAVERVGQKKPKTKKRRDEEENSRRDAEREEEEEEQARERLEEDDGEGIRGRRRQEEEEERQRNKKTEQKQNFIPYRPSPRPQPPPLPSSRDEKEERQHYGENKTTRPKVDEKGEERAELEGNPVLVSTSAAMSTVPSSPGIRRTIVAEEAESSSSPSSATKPQQARQEILTRPRAPPAALLVHRHRPHHHSLHPLTSHPPFLPPSSPPLSSSSTTTPIAVVEEEQAPLTFPFPPASPSSPCPTMNSNTKKKLRQQHHQRYRSPPPPPASVPAPPPLFSCSVAAAVADKGLRLQKMQREQQQQRIGASKTVGGGGGGLASMMTSCGEKEEEEKKRRENHQTQREKEDDEGTTTTLGRRRTSLGW